MTKNFNLAGSVYRRSISGPDLPAVVYQGHSLSYGELAERAACVAACITDHCGNSRDDGEPLHVGILASRSMGACIAVLGTCWAGATYVPFGLQQPEQRMIDLIAQCNLSAIIVDNAGANLLSSRLRSFCPPLIIHTGQASISSHASEHNIVEMMSLPPVVPTEPIFKPASDIAYVIFTSGSTGVPKGVMISAGSFQHYISKITLHLGLRATDRVLETSELSFDMSVHNMFTTWEAGGALYILPTTLTLGAVKFARNAGVTVWHSVPSLAGMLRQVKALAPDCLSGLRITIFGGEQLPVATVTAWQKTAPNSTIYNFYGPTEATVYCLTQELIEPLPVTPGRDVIAIGTPLPGNEASIMDQHGQSAPDGSPGELVIAGVQLAAGYFGSPELTAVRFPVIDGKQWYRTGDLALRDALGRFHCLGRLDNQVKVLGHRIELEEIDAHLRFVSGVDLVSSVAWPLVDGMARGVVAFVGASSINPETIVGLLKARIPAYMVPNRVITMQAMPLNTSGKVDRKALVQLLERDEL